MNNASIHGVDFDWIVKVGDVPAPISFSFNSPDYNLGFNDAISLTISLATAPAEVAAENEMLREALSIALQHVPIEGEDADAIHALVKKACPLPNETAITIGCSKCGDPKYHPWCSTSAASPVKLWDAKGGTLHLDREQWGVVMDALIEHRVSSEKRKDINAASSSDARAEMCARLIGVIGTSAAQPCTVEGGVDRFALNALVAAGHVTQAKVDKARDLYSNINKETSS